MDRFLYLAGSAIVPFVTGMVVIYYSVKAYQRTKLTAFRYWISATALGLLCSFGGLLLDQPIGAESPSVRHGIWVARTIGYIIATLLSTWGCVLLVRHLCKDERPPP